MISYKKFNNGEFELSQEVFLSEGFKKPKKCCDFKSVFGAAGL